MPRILLRVLGPALVVLFSAMAFAAATSSPGVQQVQTTKPVRVTGPLLVPVITVDVAGAGDAGVISSGGSQTISPAMTFLQDAGFLGNVATQGEVASKWSGSLVSAGTSNFSCNSNPAASSPCLANFGNAIEIGGKYPSPTTGVDVVIGAMQARTAGNIVNFYNAYGVSGEIITHQFVYNGDTKINGYIYLGQGLTDGRVICNLGSCYTVSNGTIIQWNNSSSADVVDWFADPGGTMVGSLSHSGVFSFSGNVGNAVHRGTITLSGGTGTATVNASAVCTCTDSTAVAAVKCAVSSTTLTATGTGTDVVAYLCF